MAKKRTEKVKKINLDLEEQIEESEERSVDLLISVIYKMYDNNEAIISKTDFIQRSGIGDVKEFEGMVDFFIDIGMIVPNNVLKCPECDYVIEIPRSSSGRGVGKIKCNDCGNTVQVHKDKIEKGYIINRIVISRYRVK